MDHEHDSTRTHPGEAGTRRECVDGNAANDDSGHGDRHAGHAHSYGATDQSRIGWAFVLITVFMLVEAVGGVLSGSLALLADAGHMVSDAAALAFSWVAIHYGRRPATGQLSYGYRRLEILAAFVNGCALFVIAAWIVAEAAQRFAAPVPVAGRAMLVVALAGLIANIVALLLLHGGNRENLNLRGASLHVMGDLLGSVAAIVAAAVILLTSWTPIDPILSILVALIILRSAWNIVRSAAHILLEGVPEGLNLSEIKSDLEQNVTGVRRAHHIHAWSITGEQYLLTLHIHVVSTVSSTEVIAQVQQRLAARFGIQHVTIQVEKDESDATCDQPAGMPAGLPCDQSSR